MNTCFIFIAVTQLFLLFGIFTNVKAVVRLKRKNLEILDEVYKNRVVVMDILDEIADVKRTKKLKSELQNLEVERLISDIEKAVQG